MMNDLLFCISVVVGIGLVAVILSWIRWVTENINDLLQLRIDLRKFRKECENDFDTVRQQCAKLSDRVVSLEREIDIEDEDNM